MKRRSFAAVEAEAVVAGPVAVVVGSLTVGLHGLIDHLEVGVDLALLLIGLDAGFADKLHVLVGQAGDRDALILDHLIGDGHIIVKVRGSVYLTNVGETCNKGCQSAVSAIMNTAAAVGFGSVVKITPGFAFLSELVLGIGGSPLIAESIAINVLAGATGSASGGLQIALDALADNFIQMSQTSGIPLAVFHRVGSIACGGLNTMPHDGAVVTYLSYCKISHKRGYFDMFIVAGAIPILANIVAIILGTIGIV